MDVGPSSAGETLARLPSAERGWLAKGDFRLLVPVSDGRGGLAGLIAIGEKRSELPFSREDRWLLSHTASSAGLAIGRLRPLTPSPAPANGAEPAPPPHLDPARECARCGRVHAPGLVTCTACGGPLHDAPVPLYVHGLQVERRIGTGGMGVVYEATDLALRRQVAVKTLPAVSMGHARQLRQEARAMAALSHPNLATIYALDLWRGTPLLLVEYLHGGTSSRPCAKARCRLLASSTSASCSRARSPTCTASRSCIATSSPATSASRRAAFRRCSISVSRK